MAALERAGLEVRDEDILVFTSKILSRSEGRFVDLTTVTPSEKARELAAQTQKGSAPGRADPSRVEHRLASGQERARGPAQTRVRRRPSRNRLLQRGAARRAAR